MSKCLIARVHIGIIWGFREKRHIEPNLEPTRACAPIFYFGNSHICMNWIARNGKIYEHTLSKCYSSLRLNALKYWTTNSRTTLYIKCNKLITWKIYSRWALCDSFSVLVSVRSVVFFCVALFLPLVPTFSVSFHCNTPAILVEKLFDSYTLFTIDRQFILFLFPLFPRHGYTNLNNVGNLFGEKREENREHTNEYGSECDNVSVIS